MGSVRVTVRVPLADYEYLMQNRYTVGDVLYYTLLLMMRDHDQVAKAQHIKIHKPYYESGARLPTVQYDMMKSWSLTPGAIVSCGVQLMQQQTALT